MVNEAASSFAASATASRSSPTASGPYCASAKSISWRASRIRSSVAMSRAFARCRSAGPLSSAGEGAVGRPVPPAASGVRRARHQRYSRKPPASRMAPMIAPIPIPPPLVPPPPGAVVGTGDTGPGTNGPSVGAGESAAAPSASTAATAAPGASPSRSRGSNSSRRIVSSSSSVISSRLSDTQM